MMGKGILILFQILLGILMLLIFLPLISSWLQLPSLAHLSYFLFAPFCHQLDERSFHLSGVLLPVCARCFGIYLGIFLGAGCVLFASKPVSVKRREIVILSLLLILDGMLNALGIITTPGWLRFLLGLGFGIMAGTLLGMGLWDLGRMKERGLTSRAFLSSGLKEVKG